MSWGAALRSAVGLGLGGIPSLLNAAPYPLVNFNFLSGQLDPRITFSRTSNATLIGSDGTLQYAPHNLLTYSEQFDNAAWTSKVESSVDANSAIAPDGTQSADKLVESTANAIHYVTRAVSLAVSTPHTLSVYAKAAGRSWININFYTGTTNRDTYFDLANGVVGTTAAGVVASITAVGNGWYRCSATATTDSSGTPSVLLIIGSANNTSSYLGDGTSGIYVWGAQLNVGALQPYYQTVASAYYGPRFDYDPVTLAPKGLLIEEQRTNLVFPSENFAAPWSIYNATIVADAGTAPNGTLTADRIESTGAGIFRSGVGVVNATAYTYSVFLKHVSGTGIISNIGFERFGAVPLPGSSSFNLLTGTVISNGASVTASSITVFGNGWYRVSVTVTSTDVTTTLINYAPAGNQFLMWGAQLEQGAFSTSYIPTTTAAATRAADVASVTGANFSNWYNQTEGTVVAESTVAQYCPAGKFGQCVWQVDDGTSNNRMHVRNDATLTTNSFRSINVDGINAALTLGFALNVPVKTALAYKVNEFNGASSGSIGTTDTTVNPPAVNVLRLGQENSGLHLNGHIRSFKYYPTRLRDSALQLLTR